MPCSCRSAWRRVVAVVRGDGLRCNVADVPVWRPWVPGLDSRLGFSIVKLVKSSSTRGKPRLDGGLYLRRAGRGFCTLPHPCNEAAPPPLGARCRSQIGTYAPGPGSHSGKSTCDTCAHRRAVASLRRWQEQSVVHKRPPNDPPIFEPSRRRDRRVGKKIDEFYVVCGRLSCRRLRRKLFDIPGALARVGGS